MLGVGPEGPHAIGGVLRRCKAQEHPAGGIVDHVEERALGSAAFEPVMVGAVKLDEFADGRAPGPLGAVRSLAPLDVGTAGGHEPASHGLMVDPNLVVLEQDLGEQRGPIVTVLRPPVELQDPILQPPGVSPVGALSTQPVDEAAVAFGPVTVQHSVQMPFAHVEHLCSGNDGQFSGAHLLQHLSTVAFGLCHGQDGRVHRAHTPGNVAESPKDASP